MLAHSRVLVLFVTLLSWSCQDRSPRLTLNAVRLTTSEAIKCSDLVVLGRIVDLHVSGDTRTTPDKVFVRMWRVSVQPEYTLSGTADRQFEYFLYNYSPSAGRNGDFEWLATGDRRVLFLSHIGGTLHAVADLYGTSILFPRRSIPNMNRYERSTVREKIAALLLTPSANEPQNEFAAKIPQLVPEALKAAGYSFVSKLLLSLQKSESASVRAEGCLAAVDQLMETEMCIPKDFSLVAAPIDVAKRTARAKERRLYLHKIAEDALRRRQEFPLVHYLDVDPRDPEAVLELLRFVAVNSDDVVFRLGARRELDSRAPQ